MKRLIAGILLVILILIVVFSNFVPKDVDNLDYTKLYKCEVKDDNLGFPDIYVYKDMFFLPKSEDKQYVHTKELLYLSNSTGQGWLVMNQDGGSQSTYNVIANKLEEDETKCYEMEEFPEKFQEFRLSHGIIILVNDGKHYAKN